MPWKRGSLPVPMLAWPTPVTVGRTTVRASEYHAPSFFMRLSVGITEAYFSK